MNKKFINGFLLASLVVGSAGTLSSCKDYDDDINQLRTEVAQNKSAIDAINQKIANGAILTGVSQTADGITVTVEKDGKTQSYDIKNGKDGAAGESNLWTIVEEGGVAYWALNGVVKKEYPAQGPNGEQGVQGNYWAPNAQGTALEFYKYNAETKKYELDTTVEPVKIAVEGESNGLTAVLDGNYLYINGVEDAEGAVIISRNGLLQGIGFVPQLYLDGVEAVRFGYAKQAVKTPATTSTTGDVTVDGQTAAYTIASGWEYTALTRLFEGSEVANAKFNLNPNNANLEGVNFGFLPISNVESVSRAAVASLTARPADKKVVDGVMTLPFTVANPSAVTTENGTEYPVTALQAVLTGAEDVEKAVLTSDYFSLVPSLYNFTALSYIPKTGTADEHLYATGKNAVEGAVNFNVVYTQGTKFNLKDQIRVCYTKSDFGKAVANPVEEQISLADIAEKWGLNVKFNMMNYIVGESKTSDSEFATIAEDGEVTLRYLANENPKTWVDCSDDNASRSAIGRHPIVCVTLCNGNDVILAGYVKLNIADKDAEELPIYNQPIILAENEKPFAYLCENTDAKVVSTWQSMASKVLAELGMDEKTFNATFTIEDNTVYTSTTSGTTATFTNVSDTYGDLVYNKDAGVGLTNGFLTWAYDLDAVKEINKLEDKTVTIYRKFTHNTNAKYSLYLGVTIKMADAPGVSFGTIDSHLLIAPDKVGMRVPQAKNADGQPNKVADFKATLPSYYNGGNVVSTYVGTTGAGYPTVDKMNIEYSYKFDASQSSSIKVSADGLALLDNATQDSIAKVDATTGMITYLKSTSSLKLLNSGSASANVKINATYGTCKLDFDDQEHDVINVVFEKPLVINGDLNEQIYPNGVNATEISLAKFFTIKDSYKNSLFVLNDAGQAVEEANTQGLFAYYEIESINVDLSKFTSGVKFTLNGTDVSEADGVYTVKAASGNLAYTALNNAKVVVDYNTQVLVKAYDVKIPVTINYYWGSITTEATATVNPKKD
ncbi:hypothetical protein [Duncaniella freteri]|uniref:PL29 family lyase N-terminal domain-containing protein n=1 Tax=Duncaniella freteri TaxID=2530391 RepID=UPI002577250A|nr:hypothetical protein [Duncaniella freteri]